MPRLATPARVGIFKTRRRARRVWHVPWGISNAMAMPLRAPRARAAFSQTRPVARRAQCAPLGLNAQTQLQAHSPVLWGRCNHRKGSRFATNARAANIKSGLERLSARSAPQELFSQ